MLSYYSHHEGHSCDIKHLCLRKEQREDIAVKLSAGIPFDDVLDSLHATGSSCGVNTLHFVRKQDLINIARDFGISKGVVLHRNDADSVSAWINQIRSDQSTCNLVRLVKFQGEICLLMISCLFLLRMHSSLLHTIFVGQ